jgi:large repetitive protein
MSAMRAHRLRLSAAAVLTAVAALLIASVGFGDAVCTIDWDTTNYPSGGTWNQAEHWKSHSGALRVPDASDYVCIAGSAVVTFPSGSVTVAGINVSAELDVSGGTLTLAAPADDSYVQAMTLSGGTLDGAGTIHVPDGAELLWTGGSMAGTGTTQIDNGGDLIQSSTGPTTLADGRTLDVLGTLSIDPAGGLAQTGTPSLVHVEPGGAMVRGDGTGATTVAVPLRNDGSVDAGKGTTTGDGLYLSAASTSAQIGSFTGSSTAPLVFMGGTWTMASPAGLTGTVKGQGGVLNVASGSTLDAPVHFSLTGGSIGGAGTFRSPSGAIFDWSSGSMGGTGTTTIASGATLNVSGSVALTRGLVNAGSTLVTGGLAGGTGSSITNSGSLELRGASVAALGSFTQTSSGTLEVRVGGTGFDQLAVTSAAQLAGTLAINTTVSPSPGDSFPVLTFGSRAGRFTNFTGTELGSGVGYSAQYDPGDLTLTVGSAAPPAAPTVTGTNPATVSNDLAPDVLGSAPAGTTVTIYTNSTCTSPVAGSGSSADFSGAGIQAAAAPNAPTTFYATASDSVNRPSVCSSNFATYQNDSTAPAVTLTAPSNGYSTTNRTPVFSGGAGTASGDLATITVGIYAGRAASGSPALTLTTTRYAGSWSVTPSTRLPYGTFTAAASQSDSVGNRAVSAGRTFTIAPPVPVPLLTGISPSSGPTTGGNQVVISGTGLTGSTAVRFGFRPAPRFTVNGATRITATAPAGSGTVTVTVSTPGGVSAQSAAARYAYVALPVLGRTVEAQPMSGAILIKAPGARTPVRITSLTAVALGSTVDATHGSVRIIAAAHGNGTQTATLAGAAFTLAQSSSGLLRASLVGKPLVCARSHGTAGSPLTVSPSAGFQTRGRYGSARSTGGRLLIQERCNGTLFKVLAGTAVVQGFRHHKKRTLRQGRSYLATKR